MKIGWWRNFPVNRLLTQKEKDNALSRDVDAAYVPNQRMGMVKINSTYMDWVDSSFGDRGMINTAGIFFGFVVFVVGFFVPFYIFFATGHPIFIFLLPLIVAAPIIFYHAALRYEFFTYTYYPVRFNRKNRQVYIFRHPRKGGLLVASWDDIYFHIGDSGYDWSQSHLHNVRGQILDGEKVVDTFALGPDVENIHELYDYWTFIVRYMEEGPESIGPDPLDRYIELSVAPTWRNCVIIPAGIMSGGSIIRWILWSPLIYWLAATRWLVFKTCKEPAFPPEVEAECQVPNDDPNVWPIPENIAKFHVADPKIGARSDERLKAAIESYNKYYANRKIN